MGISARNGASAAEVSRPTRIASRRLLACVAAALVMVSGCSADASDTAPDPAAGGGAEPSDRSPRPAASGPVGEGGKCPAEWLDVALQGEEMREMTASEFSIPEIGADLLADACVVGAAFPDHVLQWAVIPVPDADAAGAAISANLVAAGFVSGGTPVLDYQYGQFASVQDGRSATVGAYPTATDIPDESSALASFGRPIVVIVAASGVLGE